MVPQRALLMALLPMCNMIWQPDKHPTPTRADAPSGEGVSCDSQAQKSAHRAAGHGEAEPEGRRTNKGLEAGARRFQLADPCLEEQQRLPFHPRPILQNAQGGREETTQTTRMSTGWGNHGRGIYTGRVCWGYRQCRVCTDASSALPDPEGVALYAAPLSKRPRILSSLNASHAKFHAHRHAHPASTGLFVIFSPARGP